MSDRRVLMVGLGNPGARYAGNRHNIGFMAIDELAVQHRANPFKPQFQGLGTEVSLDGFRVLLLKPMTFMNESGQSVGQAMRFFKIALQDVIVFHDELDLPPGKLRVKTGGGNAGHNGLRSISAHIGNAYRRVRMGIGHPGDKALVQPHVLSDFAKADVSWVMAMCRACADQAALLVQGVDSEFQNRLHQAMTAAGIKA
jgi:peptidyl-tRNA hydrolase, PTH1 family